MPSWCLASSILLKQCMLFKGLLGLKGQHWVGFLGPARIQSGGVKLFCNVSVMVGMYLFFTISRHDLILYVIVLSLSTPLSTPPAPSAESAPSFKFSPKRYAPLCSWSGALPISSNRTEALIFRESTMRLADMTSVSTRASFHGPRSGCTRQHV